MLQIERRHADDGQTRHRPARRHASLGGGLESLHRIRHGVKPESQGAISYGFFFFAVSCPERSETHIRAIFNLAVRRRPAHIELRRARRFQRERGVQVCVEAGKDLCHTERRAVFRKMRRKVWHIMRSCARLVGCPAYILVVRKVGAESRCTAHDRS